MATTFDAVGAGGLNASGTATITTTENHTVAEGASMYVVFAVAQGGTTGVNTGHTRTVTVGGVAATYKTARHINNTVTAAWVEIWEIIGLTAGAKTVSVTVAKTGATYTNLKVASVSYTGTKGNSAEVAPVSGTANNTLCAHTLTGATTSYLLRAVVTQDSTLSALDNNSRYLDAGEAPALGVHDITGTASEAFAATRTTGVDWASVGVEITQTATVTRNLTGAGVLSATATIVTPLIETLTDDFAGGFDSGKWVKAGNNTAQITYPSGTLRIDHSTAAGNYNRIESVAAYDLTGSSVYVEVPDMGTLSVNEHEVQLILKLDANNLIFFTVDNTVIRADKFVAASFATVLSTTVNTATHRWWRIRESGGNVYWDTASAADPTNWTNLTSLATPFAVTALTVVLQTGNWGVAASANWAVFDNVNTPPGGVSRNAILTGTGTLSATRYPKIAVSRNLTSTGTLSATRYPKIAVSRNLTGSGTLSATRYPKIAVSKGFTGQGSLSAIRYPKFAVSKGFTGQGALAATRYPKIAVSKGFTGQGVLAAARYPKIASAATLSGQGALAATCYPKIAVSKGLTGQGVLTATAVEVSSFARNADMAGAGALAATRYPKIAVSEALTGQGVFAATTKPTFAVSRVFTGQGVLTATATMYRIASAATLSGHGALTATASPVGSFARNADMAGAGALSATRYPKFAVSKALTGQGALSAACYPKIAVSKGFAGQGALSAACYPKIAVSKGFAGQGVLAATRYPKIAVSKGFAGQGVLAATRYPKIAVSKAFTGQGVLAATATMYRIASVATLSGHGALGGATGGSRTAALIGHGVLAPQARMYQIASVATLSGHGALAATTKPMFAVSKAFTGQGVLAATATMYRIASAVALSGHGALGVATGGSRTVAVTGHGALAAQARMYRIASTATLSGHGALSATVNFGAPAAVTGHGALASLAYMYRIDSVPTVLGYGALGATVMPRLNVEVALHNHGALVTLARMYQINSASMILGQGLLSCVADGYLGKYGLAGMMRLGDSADASLVLADR